MPSLFPASILPTSILSQLPEGYTCRPLKPSDYSAGFLTVLRELTQVGEISQEAFEARYRWLQGRNPVMTDEEEKEEDERAAKAEGKDNSDHQSAAAKRALEDGEYFIVVIVDEKDTIVGTGSLIVERKFIRSLGKTGHIEDIAVLEGQRGKQLGLRLIQVLDHIAEKAGCYKTILDCSNTNEGFYVKCGFKRSGLCMGHYYQ